MFVKRGSSKQVLLLASISIMIFLAVFVVSADTGNECAILGQAGSLCSPSYTIFDEGHGAVELCDTCYKCGAHFDGVCPEDYSDGRNETNLTKTTVKMRVPRVDLGDEYTVAFSTGNLACASIGGTCSKVQKLEGTVWVDRLCTKDVSQVLSDNNANFRALCINVPRKPGCESCPDVDCTTTIAGKAYDSTTGVLVDGVNVTATWPQIPVGADYSNISNSNGEYSLNAVRGFMTISCAHPSYSTQISSVLLQRGKNIFDCKMNNLPCNPQCYTQASPSDPLICQASCNENNGCTMSPDAIAQCDGQVFGTQIAQGFEEYTLGGCLYHNVTMLTCCTGTISYVQQQISCDGNPGGDEDPNIISGGLFSADVSNIITRNYRKEFNGLPVTLKIIVYNK